MSRGIGGMMRLKNKVTMFTLSEVESLLAQEREKVRERCIEATMEGEVENMAVIDGRRRAAQAIRQLDLTKPESDLAASSGEEGK